MYEITSLHCSIKYGTARWHLAKRHTGTNDIWWTSDIKPDIWHLTLPYLIAKMQKLYEMQQKWQERWWSWRILQCKLSKYHLVTFLQIINQFINHLKWLSSHLERKKRIQKEKKRVHLKYVNHWISLEWLCVQFLSVCVCEQVFLSIFKTFTFIVVSESNFLLFKAQRAKQIFLLWNLFKLPKHFDFDNSTTYWLHISTNTLFCALTINLQLCFHFKSQVNCQRSAGLNL